MELSVYTIQGEDTGRKITLSDAIFAIEPNDHAIWLDVRQYQANSRQGTHKSKERSEMTGSTRKLGKQKGGGGARHGDINSPVMGGARVFGPKPRDYSFKLNKKVKELARKSALSYKVIDNAIMVIEDFNYDAPKTKQFVTLTNNLQLADKKSLFVLLEANKNVYLSARNLAKVQVITLSGLNTYRVLNAATLVLTESAVAGISTILNA